MSYTKYETFHKQPHCICVPNVSTDDFHTFTGLLFTRHFSRHTPNTNPHTTPHFAPHTYSPYILPIHTPHTYSPYILPIPHLYHLPAILPYVRRMILPGILVQPASLLWLPWRHRSRRRGLCCFCLREICWQRKDEGAISMHVCVM